jgi:hypothetical protein
MTTVLPIDESVAAPRRGRKWLVIAVVFFLVSLAAAAASLIYASRANSSLQRVLAETDRLDPGWRLEELEARRAIIPPEQNSANQVLAADKLLPPSWPSWPLQPNESLTEFENRLQVLSPPHSLSTRQSEILQRALSSAKAAVDAALRMSDMPNGRYAIVYTPDYVSTAVPHGMIIRRVAHLLAYEAVLLGQRQEPDAALTACRALINTARSIGDEPLITQFERLGFAEETCSRIEWTLAHGGPSAAGLQATQQLLELEEAVSPVLIALRGNRAGWDQMLQAMEAGNFRFPNRLGQSLLDNPLLRPMVHANRACVLEMQNRLVEIATLPVEEQRAAAETDGLPPEKSTPYFTQLYLHPRLQKHLRDLLQDFPRRQGNLRCTIAALAAERYRIAQGGWPKALSDLVPTYLPSVPLSPYDGKPLSYERSKDGIVISARRPPGPARTGAWGYAEREPRFALWDAGSRHQP